MAWMGARVTNKKKALASTIPLNFLLGCSEKSLGSFELARLAAVADLRGELHNILDRLIDQMAQAALTAWFRTTDRNALKAALENPEDILAWAKEQIRDGQRSEEELIPLTSLPPGAAHLAAALRYQERNIAEGKCAVCPKPLAHNSVRYCEKHLTAMRLRMTPSKGKPGSIGWLYGETEESSHGRQPGSLAALAMNREKKTRALLAELGIPPGSAAVSLKAAKEALLKVMPDSQDRSMTQAELFRGAVITAETTGNKALSELLSSGMIRRTGCGASGRPFRYFRASRDSGTRPQEGRSNA
jgi:hypothetical protein